MSRAGVRLAIVGWPVDHSLSPVLWEGVGARRGLTIEYARIPIAPGDYGAWGSVWSSALDGFNVTAPYKEQAAALCATLGPAAAAIGAVNTVFRREDAWAGHSTDGYGFVRSLLASGEPLRGREVVVLGTGGAGRAVARAAVDASAQVTLVSRSPSADVRGCDGIPRIDWEALLDAEPFDVVVNATPIGRGRGAPPPLPYASGFGQALAVDLNYAPPVTPFLEAAHAAGARTLNGLGMLIHQACLGAALVLDDDPAAAEAYEEDFWAAARTIMGDRS